MLLANYGSDSGSDSESEAGPSKASKTTSTATAVPTKAPAKPLTKGKGKGPVKITLDLPKAKGGDPESGEEDGDAAPLSRIRGRDDVDAGREAKKPKIQGKGRLAV